MSAEFLTDHDDDILITHDGDGLMTHNSWDQGTGAGSASGGDCDCCCVIATDDFDRDDSDDPGGQWDERAGDWDIASNVMVTSSNSGLLLHKTAAADENHVVTVKVMSDTSGAIVRAFIGYEDDDNYLVAELTIDATCGTLKLYDRESGVETQVGVSVPIPGAIPGAWHTLSVCFTGDYSGGQLRAQVTDSAGDVRAMQADADAAGTQGGLATGSLGGGQASFDDFVFEKHYQNADGYRQCPRCRPPGCDVFEDAFTRSDSTDLGCEWSEEAGSWLIASNQLTTASASAVCLCLVPHPQADASGRLTFQAQVAADGDEIIAQVDWIDADNHHKAVIIPGNENAGADGTLRLYKREAGADTQLGSDYTLTGVQSGELLSIQVCWDEDYITAGVAGDGESELTTMLGGERFALAAGTNSGTMVFDTVDFNKVVSVDDPGCLGCSVLQTEPCAADFCVDSQVPELLLVRITNVADEECLTNFGSRGPVTDCELYDDYYVLEFIPGNCNWIVTFPHRHGDSCDPGIEYDAALAVVVSKFSSTVWRVAVTLDLASGAGDCGAISWRRDFDAPLDCASFDGLEVPFLQDQFDPNCCIGGANSRAYVWSL